MKATCPTNPEHNAFTTVVHVTEDWSVDRDGEFFDKVDGPSEVVHGPNPDNTWTCEECGAEANVEE